MPSERFIESIKLSGDIPEDSYLWGITALKHSCEENRLTSAKKHSIISVCMQPFCSRNGITYGILEKSGHEQMIQAIEKLP